MRRIQREVQHEALVKRLTTGDQAVFGEIWRLLLFCAALGVHHGSRRALAKVDTGKAMPENYFSSPGWRGFLYLIGIVETDGSDVLRTSTGEQDQLITMFEEYANGGLYLLADRLEAALSPLDALTSLLLEQRAGNSANPDVSALI